MDEDQREFIARLYIENFRQKLLSEQDEATRRTVVRLLAEEEAKLAALTDPGKKQEED